MTRTGRHKFGIMGTFALLLAWSSSPAQTPHFRDHPLPAEYKDPQVTSVFQDSRGFIWLGTNNGAVRFDGFEYKHFLQRQEFGNEVSALYEDDSLNLWIGYRNGRIARLQSEKFVSFNPDEGFPSVAITGFAEDGKGNLWVATYGEGLYIIGKGKVTVINKHDGLNDNAVYSITSDNKGKIFAGTDNGMAICEMSSEGKSVKQETTADGLPDNIITAIHYSDKHGIVVGTESMGLVRYDENSGRFLKRASAWTYGRVTDILEWDDALWVGTSGKGIIEVGQSLADNRPLRIANDPLARIFDLAKDREGNIWIASGTSATYSTNRTFTFLNPTVGTHAQALLHTRDGQIIYSTGQGLFSVDKAGKGERETIEFPDADLNGINVISLYEDSVGYIWLGTFDKGVYRLDRKKKELLHIGQQHGLVNNNILSIAGIGKNIWLATLGGVTRLSYKSLPPPATDPKKKPAAKPPARKGKKATPVPPDPRKFFDFQNYTSENGLGSNFIYKVFIDSKKRVWFATDGKGVTVYENGTFTNFSVGDGARSNIIYSITEGNDGTIWVSNAHTGLFSIKDNALQQFVPHSGFRDMAITSIVADRSGNILIVSKQGVDVLNPGNGTLFYHGDEFGVSRIDPDLNAVARDSAGTIWIGTQRGIIRYNAAAPTQPAPMTRINRMLVFLSDPDKPGQKIFEHDQNHISFDYIAFWYHDPEEVTYQTKLEGHDMDWVVSRNRFVSYPNLQPGDYTFNVRASATNHFEGVTPQKFSFTIRAPFYNTVWFYATCAALTLGLLILFVATRERRLKRKERLRREQVQFQLETLKSQVNPHFLFNSFNTLASVIEQDPAVAVEYVERLSDFYRNILLHRQQDLIPLSKELSLIDNYYYLQLKRYRQNFVMEVNVPAELLDKKIPPLTLQLLVENAVKHNIISTGQPLIIEIFVSENQYLAVRNNLQRKSHHEPSTGIGLNNITNRFRILTDKPVHIKEDDEYFTVFIPLLD
jgi:ligand-binding sensor domain-containing protein